MSLIIGATAVVFGGEIVLVVDRKRVKRLQHIALNLSRYLFVSQDDDDASVINPL